MCTSLQKDIWVLMFLRKWTWVSHSTSCLRSRKGTRRNLYRGPKPSTGIEEEWGSFFLLDPDPECPGPSFLGVGRATVPTPGKTRVGETSSPAPTLRE